MEIWKTIRTVKVKNKNRRTKMNVFLDFFCREVSICLTIWSSSIEFFLPKDFWQFGHKIGHKRLKLKKKLRIKLKIFFKGIVHYYSEFPKRFNIFDNKFSILLNSQKKNWFLIAFIKKYIIVFIKTITLTFLMW
jgi:hypothetical protein